MLAIARNRGIKSDDMIFFSIKINSVICTCSFAYNDQYTPLNTTSRSVNNKKLSEHVKLILKIQKPVSDFF